MDTIVKEYTNDEITIVWKPALCTHSRRCRRGLPEVFDPEKRPWVNVTGVESEIIIKQIEECPSGALTYFVNNERGKKAESNKDNACSEVKIIHNGPALIKTRVCITSEGKPAQKSDEGVALCRCSKSGSQPCCDGTHELHPFE